MTIAVQKAGPASAEILSRLHGRSFDRAWSAEELSSLLYLPANLALVAGECADPTGFVLIRIAADEAEVLTICTDPDRRRSGAARALLTAGEEAAATRGATRVFLEVAAGNSAARALYAQAGYLEIGLRKAYYANGEDAIVLEKSLSGDRQTGA